MSDLVDFFEHPDAILGRATDADVVPLVAMINDAYAYQQEATGVPRTSAERLRQQTDGGELYVAKRNNEVVGSIYTRYDDRKFYLGMLAVTNEMRGTGLAPVMMAAAEGYARILGATSMGLEFLAQAEWLGGYYAGYGFGANGEVREPRPGIQLLHMSKFL